VGIAGSVVCGAVNRLWSSPGAWGTGAHSNTTPAHVLTVI